MNRNEKNHIKLKSLDLINNTEVTPNLLSRLTKHLSDYDRKVLQKKGELKTDIDQADAFYQLVVKKKGIYNDLIEALELEGQVGPADWLQELPQEKRDVSTNNGEIIRAPEPQLPENEPNASHQGQRIAVIAPLGQGQVQPNGLLENETLDSDIAMEGSGDLDFLR